MTSAAVEERINHQEMKDFQRAKMLLTSHFNSQGIAIKKFMPRAKGCSVDALIDIEYQNEKRTLNLEIKERHKNETLIRRFPFAELKVEKLNLMRLENKKNDGDLKYLSLYTDPTSGELEAAFYYDLKGIQNGNFPMRDWKAPKEKGTTEILPESCFVLRISHPRFQDLSVRSRGKVINNAIGLA
jgi:hypothetical protein